MLDVETRRYELSTSSGSGLKTKEAALAGLYDECYDRVVRYIFVRVGNQADAEDLAGEVFVRAVKSLRSFGGPMVQMRFWIFRVAHNIVVDHYRKNSNRHTVPLEPEALTDGRDIEEITETKLQIDALLRALPQLTPAQREVIGLRFFAGFSSVETGEILGKSSGAVREMQRSAVEKLRQLM